MLKKILAFDYGKARIGIATGQTLTKTASPVTTIKSINGKPNWKEIEAIIKKWRPNEFVVGLPIDMHGEFTDSTKAAQAFGEELEKRVNKPIHFVDEKLSTREARWRLESVSSKTARHLKVDAMAACIILETWMNMEPR